jgi:hypothetical protein
LISWPKVASFRPKVVQPGVLYRFTNGLEKVHGHARRILPVLPSFDPDAGWVALARQFAVPAEKEGARERATGRRNY